MIPAALELARRFARSSATRRNEVTHESHRARHDTGNGEVLDHIVRVKSERRRSILPGYA
jgi:hypothetical protein